MSVRISSELLDGILAEAALSPDEVCGLLFGTGAAIKAVEPCRNVAADPRRRFEIDPAALIRAYRSMREGGPALLGGYHSHPGGIATPSPRDAADAAPDGQLWLIVGDGEARLFRAVPDGALHGRFDPIALIVS